MLVIANSIFQQPKRQLYTWISPDGQYKKKDYVFVAKDGEAYTVSQTRPGADCGTDHELVIARFRLKLKKEGNTMRPFRYNLNQIPYVYTVEVMNRFKGLGLVDRVPEEL